MEKVLIYGAGQGGLHIYEEIKNAKQPLEVIGFIDKRSGGVKSEQPIIAPSEIGNYDFDRIIVATDDNSVKEYLIKEYDVGEEKINTEMYQNSVAVTGRVRALEHLAEVYRSLGIQGSTAEVGVYQGDFAKHINRIFPESTLYLYDTFEGFSEEDLNLEKSDSAMHTYKHYSKTSEDLVMSKMVHPNRVKICKGFFPQTAKGQSDKYVFVNLDADLYAPILAGLKYFYPKLTRGGNIFVHDYFNPGCPGVKQAVDEFFHEEDNAGIVPLGDYLTVAITKPVKRNL